MTVTLRPAPAALSPVLYLGHWSTLVASRCGFTVRCGVEGVEVTPGL